MAYTKSTLTSIDFPARLSIRSEQCCEGQEPDIMEQTVDGTLTVLPDGVFQLRYREHAESGMAGVTVTIEVQPNQMVLTRQGAVACRMAFVSGGHDVFQYRTPYGTLRMELDTNQLQARLSERGGVIFLRYCLTLAGQDSVRCRLRIRVQPKQSVRTSSTKEGDSQ